MSFIVCGDCTAKIPARYDKGICDPVLDKFGSLRAIFKHCDTGSFTDILDVAEWGTKVTAGSIIITPGYTKLEFGDASDDVL